MQSFFIFCSGADTHLINKCSPGEQTKYAGIGATVFFTAIMAAFAGSYALFTVFDNLVIAVAFGLIWGLLIFNLDRFIVSTIRKDKRWWREWLQALPRLLLAVIIAVVISKPLELKLFEKEIDQVLLEEKNQMLLDDQQQVAALYESEQSAFAKAIQDLKTEIATKEAEVNALYDVYIAEAEGTAGTQKIGKGPVYKEKREKHDAALAELTALKAQNFQKIADLEIKAAQQKESEKLRLAENSTIIEGFDGLMARIDALNKLPIWTSFFIFLLFLAVETSPIFAKLIAPKGEYDFRFQRHEGTIKTWVEQELYQMQNAQQADQELTVRVFEDLKEDQDVLAHRKQKAGELLRQQADAHHHNQSSVLPI
jgi:amino acid transporter